MKKSARTIFIWDVQWCYDELKLLLKKLKLKKHDRVFFVWDLINRWPKSYKVLKYLYKNKHRFQSVIGNHELNFLRWINGEKYKDSKDFKTLYKKIQKNRSNYLINFIGNLPRYIEEKDFILLHGWIIPNKPLKEHTDDEITRTRDYNKKPWYEYYDWKKPVIYGHWAEENLQIREKTKGLDSGCVYGKALTAYVLETWEVIQQTALDIYVNVYNKKKPILERVLQVFNKKNIWEYQD